MERAFFEISSVFAKITVGNPTGLDPRIGRAQHGHAVGHLLGRVLQLPSGGGSRALQSQYWTSVDHLREGERSVCAEIESKTDDESSGPPLKRLISECRPS